MSSRTQWIATLCCAAGLTLAPLSASAQNFLTDLGTGSASGLNNSGQVVLSNGIWSNGTVTAFPAGFSGKAINAQGDVAGVTAAGHAALDIAGAVTDLGTLRGEQIIGVAAINASDQFVGSALQAGGVCCVAYMYSGGVITPINFPQPHPGATGSLASGINDGGEVTGCTTGSPTQEAAIFVNGTFTDLGPGCANAINASGQVTGYQLSASLNASHAFIYANGTMTVLTEPPPANNSEAVAINSGGQTVGTLSDPQTDEGAFFFDGVMSNVNLLISAADPLKSVTISQAVAINDNRLLLLSGYSGVGPPHAYLLQAPWIDVAPGPLTFPNQLPGTTSAAQLVTLTNSGAVPLPVDSIASRSSEFPQTNACPNPLPPSANCTVSVKFAPNLAGDRTSNLDVMTAGATIAVPLAGTGALQVTISASASTAMTGVPITLSWAASSGAICVANGGSASISGAGNDGWAGPIAASGTQSVTESIAATFTYGLTCTVGSQSADPTTGPVIVTWPALTVTLKASPTTISSGNSTMLTWTSANAKTCIASGGGTDDGWAGSSRATSGSEAIAEPVVVAAPLTLTYTLTCSNSGTSQSTPASVNVILDPPASSGGGGGSLDWMCVLFLAGFAAWRSQLSSRPQ